jgi:hypothetical protein
MKKNKEGYILKHNSYYVLFVGNQIIELSEAGFELMKIANVFPIIDVTDLKDRLLS